MRLAHNHSTRKKADRFCGSPGPGACCPFSWVGATHFYPAEGRPAKTTRIVSSVSGADMTSSLPLLIVAGLNAPWLVEAHVNSHPIPQDRCD